MVRELKFWLSRERDLPSAFRRLCEADGVSVEKSYWVPVGNSKTNGKRGWRVVKSTGCTSEGP